MTELGVDGADISPSSVDTDDIPTSSWVKWSPRNWVQADINHIDYDLVSDNVNTTTTGSGISNQNTIGGYVELDTGSTSGSTVEGLAPYRVESFLPSPSF